MMDAATIRAKLEKACAAAGAALSDVPGDPAQWVIRPRSGGDPLAVRLLGAAETVTFARPIRLPGSLASVPGAPPERQVAASAVANVDALLRAEPAADERGIIVTFPAHLDGFTVQEALRAMAALDRATAAVATAIEGARAILGQSQELARALEEAQRTMPTAEQLETRLREASAAGAAAAQAAPARPAAPAPAFAAAPVVSGRRVCPNPQCGREIPQGAGFCNSCGTRAAAAPPAAAAPTASHCPQCGRALAPGSRFCTSCGARLA